MADLLRLFRVRLCLLATVGTAAGYLLWRARLDPGLLLTAAGAFLLAAGCSALNQVQEKSRDAAMTRTRSRPLPSQRLGQAQALCLALACLGAALALLWLQGGLRTLLTGLAVVLLYNGLYTPMKKASSFALLVGGVAGALPPVLGWQAAGGLPGDFRALIMATAFYLWQVPHFALLARLHPGDYQAAGLPLAGLAQDGDRGAPQLMLWLAAYAAILAMIPACDLVASGAAKTFLVALAVALLLGALASRKRHRRGLLLVNLSLILFLSCLIADALWWGA